MSKSRFVRYDSWNLVRYCVALTRVRIIMIQNIQYLIAEFKEKTLEKLEKYNLKKFCWKELKPRLSLNCEYSRNCNLGKHRTMKIKGRMKIC